MLAACCACTATGPAATLRLASFNIEQGFGAVGTGSRDQATALIARVSPDVLAVVEAQGGTDLTNFSKVAQDLGYPHAVVSASSTLDTTLRTGFFSRYPVVLTNWVQSPGGAVEMTRQNLAVKIDVPGTARDPLVIVVHPKCCSSGSGQESFRRAIELRRTRETVEALSIPAIDNVFVVGDYNLVGSDNAVFTNLPTGLPGSYRLGSDVVFPVTYRTNPAFYFDGTGLEPVPIAQVNGATKTWSTRSGSASVLDYILASAPVRARSYRTEVYSSMLDAGTNGLPKPGPLPATNASSLASDHFLLVGDFDLGGPDPAPVISWPTASDLVAGQALGESVLSGGAGAIPGSFAFADPSFVPPAGAASWPVVFTPQNVLDYTAVTNLVAVNVVAAPGGSLFDEWRGATPASPETLRVYAIGGGAGPDGSGAVPPAIGVSAESLVVTAVVRTNDPSLAVTVSASVDLTAGSWSTNGITTTVSTNQLDVPEGHQRQIFSIPRGTNASQFLRLDSVLQP